MIYDVSAGYTIFLSYGVNILFINIYLGPQPIIYSMLLANGLFEDNSALRTVTAKLEAILCFTTHHFLRWLVLEHVVHCNDQQRNIGVGSSVSQKRIALAVPVIKWLLTARQQLVSRSLCSSIDLHRNKSVRASEETIGTVVLDALEDKRDSCHLGEPTSMGLMAIFDRIFSLKIEYGREFFVLRSRKIEKPTPLRITSLSSNNRPHLRIDPLHLRSSAPNNENNIFLRSSKPKNEEPFPSWIFDLRPKISNKLHIFDLRPRRSVRRSNGSREGGRLLRRWEGFFEDGDFLWSCGSEERRTSYLQSSRPEERKSHPSSYSSSESPFSDRYLPGHLSSPEISLLSPIFHLEDGSEDRDRPSIRTDPSASRPASPRASPPTCRAPPRPDPPVVYPGFGLDR